MEEISSWSGGMPLNSMAMAVFSNGVSDVSPCSTLASVTKVSVITGGISKTVLTSTILPTPNLCDDDCGRQR
ncbi:hypothetical protein [Allosalinactinospora lopnorensis]|uniref:hypothetical protein n=1 Tax=Allosalinactinospora lopnorensis TaxID=1352348 RepID=UPI0012E32E4F|nr:hypothetical protein [Allosalinactinospora lopnorensis]